MIFDALPHLRTGNPWIQQIKIECLLSARTQSTELSQIAYHASKAHVSWSSSFCSLEASNKQNNYQLTRRWWVQWGKQIKQSCVGGLYSSFPQKGSAWTRLCRDLEMSSWPWEELREETHNSKSSLRDWPLLLCYRGEENRAGVARDSVKAVTAVPCATCWATGLFPVSRGAVTWNLKGTLYL